MSDYFYSFEFLMRCVWPPGPDWIAVICAIENENNA